MSLTLGLLAAALAGSARGQSAPEPGLLKNRELPPGWNVARTAHYEVQAEIAPARAQRLADFLEALRPHFEALWPPRPRLEPLVVKVFASHSGRDAWMAGQELGYDERAPGAPASCAIHEAFTGDILAWDSGRLLDDAGGAAPVKVAADRALSLSHAELQLVYPLLAHVAAAYAPDLARDVAHEAWHQYVDSVTLSRPPLPAWLNEGVADWLAAATPGARPWDLRLPAPPADDRPLSPGALHEDRLRDVLRARRAGQTLPVGELLQRGTHLASVEPPGLVAQGWAVVHFLQTRDDARLRALVPAFLEGARKSDDGRVPAEKVLEGIDLRALDRAWDKWLDGQQAIDPLVALVREFGRKLAPEDLQAAPWIQECYAELRRKPGPPR